MRSILIIRLSSLGDIILATSVLETFSLEDSVEWVVKKEFSSLLHNHPRIHRLHLYDSQTGMAGWFFLAKILWKTPWTHVFDLHRTWRSLLLRFFFFFFSCQEKKKGPRWRSISKHRLKYAGYFLFKKYWPVTWRPPHVIQNFLKCVGYPKRKNRPDLEYLIQGVDSFPEGLIQKPYICVMPSSRWVGKTWNIEYYLICLERLPFFPVILGTNQDHKSHELVRLLEKKKVPHRSFVGQYPLSHVAFLLKNAHAYFGSDTGLAHLAEALGTPSWVIYGPTRPDQGFGVSLKKSIFLETELWCRPCGKTGHMCYRPFQKYLCLKNIFPDKVLLDIDRHEKKD